MRYAPNPDPVVQEMLRATGLSSLDDLFVDVPEEIRLQCLLPESRGMTEMSARRQLEELALANYTADDSPIFLGAGCYDHYVPTAVDAIVGRSEFVTAYTPYQPEISQGLLQAIFEYQTAICRLTGMDVANASMYCGGSALAQACVMAAETTKRKIVLIPATLNPDYARIVETYSASGIFEARVVPEKNGLVDLDALNAALAADAKNVAGVVIQYPNFYGNLERVGQTIAATKGVGALAIMSVDPIALAMLKSPGEWGADVAVGDGQPLGNAMSFGGPHLGFMAVSKKLLRKIPGRLVGETVDSEGKRAYVLTLQAREQHIRREKASSNICSNQALNALTALVYLAFVGPLGLKQAANASHRIACYARSELKKAGFEFQHDAPFLREFAVKVDKPREMNRYLLEWGIIGGFELKDGLLLAFTEKRTREEVDELVYFMKDFQFGGAGERLTIDENDGANASEAV